VWPVAAQDERRGSGTGRKISSLRLGLVMAYHNKKFRLFVAPTWAVNALILTNMVVYAACARDAEGFIPNVSTLLRFGAVTASTVTDHQYWRLLAAGFLHFNPTHLLSNMLCLALWGGPLEKRIGTLYFALIYFSSVLAGNLVTVLTHQTPFIGAGASGGISGILAALLALCLLGKIELSITYIISNITLNVMASVAVPGIDWRAHFGGFCAGFIGCAILDSFLSTSHALFWCKIPEFIKLNTAILAGIWGIGLPLLDIRWSDPQIMFAKACVVLFLYIVVLKLIDALLVLKKGLMFSVLGLAALNALAVFVWRNQLLRMIALLLQEIEGDRNEAVTLFHASLSQMMREPTTLIAGTALVVFCATLMAYRIDLQRGWNDVGFLGASFRAERNRVQGL
jgi:membrane associated rhomboid family serine protease